MYVFNKKKKKNYNYVPLEIMIYVKIMLQIEVTYISQILKQIEKLSFGTIHWLYTISLDDNIV